ncbi:MAG: MBL fold metallo-hydrolase [Acetobacteraceae bacterium]|nr:MBL fold metallo-hydrolase [Acetobacteraceae bacterium]
MPQWLVRVVVPTPFGVGPVNVYLLPGPPVTLVDAGPDTPQALSALESALAGQGLGVRDVERVLLTHTHPDHAGLAGRLEELGAAVYLHPADAHRLAPGGLSLAPRVPLLRWAGVPEVEIERLRRQAERNQGFVRPAGRPRPLEPGQAVEFEGFRLKVLHTPGHSLGHLCFWGGPGQPELLAGDCLLPRISPNPLLELADAGGRGGGGGLGAAEGRDMLSGSGLGAVAGEAPAAGGDGAQPPPRRYPSLERYLVSLEGLFGLEVDRVHPGHGEPFCDHRRAIAALRWHHWARLRRLARFLGSEPRSPWELADRLFPGVGGWERFLAVSEVVAHLSLLAHEGRALEEIGGDGVVRYRRPASGGPGKKGQAVRRESHDREGS